MGTLFAILLALGTLAGSAAIGERITTTEETKKYNDDMRKWIRENYPELSPSEVEGLVSQYGDKQGGLFDISKWGDQSDWDSLKSDLEKLYNAYDELGEMPESLSSSEIENIRTQAGADIDKENQGILDLYNQSFQNTRNALQNQLVDNAAMFGDYRNQILTNNAMNQQAIAGSARFELDRQQRNAITRGASAAQRLVANINTQLGLQAQSAQQSLETSNALAQQLLAQRQAQQGIRNDYLNAQNNFTNQQANLLSGQTERKFNYGQSKVDAASDDRERAYDNWVDRRDEYFKGNSMGSALYGTGSHFKRPTYTLNKLNKGGY